MEPLENSPEHRDDPWSRLKLRATTAVLLLIPVMAALWIGGIFFTALIILATILMMKEWEELAKYQMLLLRYAGYPYTIIAAVSLIWMRDLSPPENPALGSSLILTFIALVTATDIGAYFIGMRFGKRKLAPSISPNKSWEGAIGGLGAAILVGVIFLPYTHVSHSFFSAVAISILLSVLAQAGDLFESWLKRKAGTKDSGTLLPGHGGLLDRLDSYMFAAPVFALIVHHSLQGA